MLLSNSLAHPGLTYSLLAWIPSPFPGLTHCLLNSPPLPELTHCLPAWFPSPPWAHPLSTGLIPLPSPNSPTAYRPDSFPLPGLTHCLLAWFTSPPRAHPLPTGLILFPSPDSPTAYKPDSLPPPGLTHCLLAWFPSPSHVLHPACPSLSPCPITSRLPFMTCTNVLVINWKLRRKTLPL